MERVIAGAERGLLRQALVFYQNAPVLFLRTDNNLECAMSLVLHTRYGLLYSSIRMEKYFVSTPQFVVDFDTQAPSRYIERLAVERFGSSFEALPEHVNWDMYTSAIFKVGGGNPLLLTQIQMEPTEYCGGTEDGPTGTAPDRSKKYITETEVSEKFFNKTILQVMQELNGMKILREGAVLSLLKFKVDLPRQNRGDEPDERLTREVGGMLGKIKDPDIRPAILMHADRSIRVAGMPLVTLAAEPAVKAGAKRKTTKRQ